MAACAGSLGNFLSGMETLRVLAGENNLPRLGNFLSGMETPRKDKRRRPLSALGNFLSGMETWPRHDARGTASWPWKLP